MRKRNRTISAFWMACVLTASLLAGCAGGGRGTDSTPPSGSISTDTSASTQQSGSVSTDTSAGTQQSSSAGTDASASAPQDISDSVSGSVPESAPEPPAPFVMPAGMHWAVEPTLELDNIQTCTFFRGSDEQHFNAYGLITPDGLSEASINGKCGLIDHSGTWAAPCEFTYILCGFDGKYSLDQYEEDSYATFVFDGTELRKPARGETVSITGTAMPPFLCWVAKDKTLSIFSDCSVSPPYAAHKPLNYPSRALYMGEEEGTLNMEENGQRYYSWYPDLDAWRYVLYDGNGSVTEELYEKMGCVAEGIVPAMKDGKWGCLDTRGNVVFPFEYDGTITYISDTGALEHGGCYNATENTIVLCKEGAYALYTVSGEEVIPFGIFAQLLPVHEGRLWAKVDGKWGVLELEQAP